jgi:hypothetical protein
MAKIKLGNTPKTFKRTIEIVNIDGTVNTLDITYKYRTRRQFAELVDGQIAAAKATADAEAAAAKAAGENDGDDSAPKAAEPQKTVAELVSEQFATDASAVLEIAEGWDLDDKFNADTLAQLEDENPGALFAITQAYRAAVVDVRVKN